MPRISADTRRFFATHPKGYAAFDPEGKKAFHPNRERFFAETNPPRWEAGKEIFAARLFVGFNVGTESRWMIEDAIEIVNDVRQKQVGDPASSFITQKGIYKHKRSNEVVVEDGCQIVIIDSTGASEEAFVAQMQELAEILADLMEQEEVVLEIQKNGVVLHTWGMEA